VPGSSLRAWFLERSGQLEDADRDLVRLFVEEQVAPGALGQKDTFSVRVDVDDPAPRPEGEIRLSEKTAVSRLDAEGQAAFLARTV